MDKKRAKFIGRLRALEAVVIGISIFYLIGVFIFSNEGLQSLLWLKYLDLYNWIFVANWVVTFLVVAVVFMGAHAGKKILIQRRSHILIGSKTGFLTIAAAAFFGCLLGFLMEGFEEVQPDEFPLVDYFMKPVFWIFIYGLVPSVLMGIYFGWRIKQSR